MKKYNKVLLIGSGALKIGEAGEFDYSGSQALKALKEEGIYTILINPNIATVQTSDNIADDVYFLPITSYFVEQVIKKEKPDAIMVAFGGQTALNCAVELYKNKIFEKYNIEVLGTPIHVIMETEDRDIFAQKMDEINVETARSIAVKSVKEAVNAANKIGYPVIVRAAYALGGLGSGFAYNKQELIELTKKSFTHSPQVLIEESLKGWKELEYEVIRDKYGNCVTVCNMENFDPVGVHTGESIVVAPSQTLTSLEYHKLREVAIRTIQHLGIIGECNIQYALDPNSEEYRVIEVNARLSRSSALASKATGYPLAFVAAKLALGYAMYEITNSVTQTTCAFFEPALDYCVVKIPRWDLEKFVGVQRNIGSSMKSVGEIMAIGRSFEEAIQKGIRMLDSGKMGFVGNTTIIKDEQELEDLLSHPNDERIYRIADAFDLKFSVKKISELTQIDNWFLQRLERIHKNKEFLQSKNHLSELSNEELLELKKTGFSDQQISLYLFNNSNHEHQLIVREERKKRNIKPVVKQIDTLAAEFPSYTNYLYMTYHGIENDIDPEVEQSVAILGSGAYRIGSSVEFDWGGVITAQTASKLGYKTIIVNYNPETVSTDYDLSDRLYFEELSFERVMDILDYENPYGTILSTGGQIPNNLAIRLFNSNIHILGTSPLDIDNAENRHKFSFIMDELGILQPRWKELTTLADMKKFIDTVGFPALIRPSYVLSGAAMNVISNNDELIDFLALAREISAEYPIVISEFIQGAKELELDAVAKNGEIIVSAISEHVEFAGVHSGDATMYYPPQKMYIETAKRIKRIGEKIAKRYNISGPFNIQFLGKKNELKVIELNLRASRSFPFVSKISGINFIEKATQVVLNQNIEKVVNDPIFCLDYVGVKASQFSFARLQGADPALGVDMSSTGEVACIAGTVEEALLKSMLSVGYQFPEDNILISGGPIESKITLFPILKKYSEKGFELFATEGTHHFLAENGVKSTLVFWPDSAKEPNVITKLKIKEIKFVINIPKNLSKVELDNDYNIRRTSVDFNIPLITNARLAEAFLEACDKFKLEDTKIMSWKEYKKNNIFINS